MANREHNTKITYTVDGAIDSVEKLADATAKAATDSEKNLSKIGSAVESLGSRLGGVGNHAGTAFRALSGFGAVGGSIAGVAASVAGLALSLVSVKTLFRDIIADGKAFNAAVGKNLALQKSLVDLESAPGDAALTGQRLDLRNRMSDLASAKDASAQMKSLIAQETASRQSAYQQATAAANAHYNEAMSLQKRLNNITDQRVTSTGSVGDILRASRQTGGDLDRTASLLDAAKRKAEATQDAAGLSDVAVAERKLESSIRNRLAAQSRAQAVATQQANVLKSQIALLGQFAAKQQEVQQRQSTETVNLRNQSRELTNQEALNKLGAAASKSTLGQAAALKQLNDAQQDSAKPGFKEGAYRALSALLDPTQLKAFRDQFSEAESLGDRITKALNVDSSAANIRKLAPDIARLGKLIEGFESVKGGQPAGFETGVDRIQRMEEALKKLSEGAANQIKSTPNVLDQLQQLSTEGDPLSSTAASSNAIATNLASALSSARQLAEIGGFSPMANAQAAIGSGRDAAPVVAAATGPPTPVNQNITVSLQGGMLDSATIQQFVQAVQRQARLGLG